MLHWTRFTLAAGAAVAVAIATPASAQLFPRRTTPAPAQPAPAQPPAAQPPAATPQQAQQPTASAGDTAANARLQQVADTANNIYAVAKFAQGRAQSQQAKDLASKVVSQWQPVLTQVNSLAVQRGLKFGSASPQAQQDLQGTMKYLGGLSGAQFDQAFIQAEVKGFNSIEQQLKDLREATPGSDAQLKKWLDDTENVSEQSLADSRQARQQFREVQGRTGQ